MSENSQRANELALANLNASLANLGVNIIILNHIEEQLAMQKKLIEENAKFHKELLQTLDVIIKNQ